MIVAGKVMLTELVVLGVVPIWSPIVILLEVAVIEPLRRPTLIMVAFAVPAIVAIPTTAKMLTKIEKIFCSYFFIN